jgi:hypothetical protein
MDESPILRSVAGKGVVVLQGKFHHGLAKMSSGREIEQKYRCLNG